MTHRYLIALGSNVRLPRVGGPRRVIAAALAALDDAGLRVEAAAPVIGSVPLGPALRRYANTCAVVECDLAPEAMLTAMQAIETRFARRRRGQRWRARTLDLDIILWTGGAWSSPKLTIPHPQFRRRAFVLGPAARIAGAWRDPITRHTVRQLAAVAADRSPVS